jgi:hypothetical protein
MHARIASWIKSLLLRRSDNSSTQDTQALQCTQKTLAMLVLTDWCMSSSDLTMIREYMPFMKRWFSVNKELRYYVTSSNALWLHALDLIMHDSKETHKYSCAVVPILAHKIAQQPRITPYQLFVWCSHQMYFLLGLDDPHWVFPENFTFVHHNLGQANTSGLNNKFDDGIVKVQNSRTYLLSDLFPELPPHLAVDTLEMFRVQACGFAQLSFDLNTRIFLRATGFRTQALEIAWVVSKRDRLTYFLYWGPFPGHHSPPSFPGQWTNHDPEFLECFPDQQHLPPALRTKSIRLTGLKQGDVIRMALAIRAHEDDNEVTELLSMNIAIGIDPEDMPALVQTVQEWKQPFLDPDSSAAGSAAKKARKGT